MYPAVTYGRQIFMAQSRANLVSCLVRHCACLLVALFLVIAPAHGQPAGPAVQTRFITLGTGGGPVIRVKRSEPANAVVVAGSVYLFDVGDGVQRQLAAAGLSLGQVKAIFISHNHMDHNGGLGPLIMSHWLFSPAPAWPVIGAPGTVLMVHGLAQANLPTVNAPIAIGGPPAAPVEASVAPADLPATLDVPTEIFRDDNVRILAISVDHFHLPPELIHDPAPRSYAFRIETSDRIIVYSGDTGPSAHLTTLAHGADLLVTEVINLPAVEATLRKRADMTAERLAPYMAHMRQDHLTPEAIGRIAHDAHVKAVVLTHISPGMDDETDLSGYTLGIAPTFGGPVTVARDLDQF